MKTYQAGIDVGSTTVKLVVLDENGQMIFGQYQRHLSHTQRALSDLLKQARAALGDFDIHGVLPFFCDGLPKTLGAYRNSPPRNQFALSFPAIIGCGDDELGECPSDHRTHDGIRIR